MNMYKENLTDENQSVLKRKRRRINTTKEQYEIYLSVMEQDYILRSGIVNPTVEENYIKKKWEELVSKLNSNGNGACLSIEDWKNRFNDWKNTTRAKYRKIKENLNKTGGGEATKLQLTDLEERGLCIWGKVTVAGSNLVEETGGLQHISAINPETPEIPEISATFSSLTENATTTIITPTEVAESNAICSEERITHNNISEDNIIIDITNIMNNTSNERTTNKSVKKVNTSQKSGKSKEKQFPRKNLSETASSLLNVYEKQMLSNSNLHESVEYFFKKYAENEERKIKMKEEQIKLKKEEIKNKEIKLKFEIAKYKYLHSDFLFEY